MSCISLLDYVETEEEAFDPSALSWPALVRGIRVYAVRQPPTVASELLELADLAQGIGELEERRGHR